MRNYVLQHPNRQKAIEERKKECDRRCNTSAIGAANHENDEQGKLITVLVAKAQRNAAALSGVVYPQNRSSRSRNNSSLNRNTPPPQVSTNGSSEASVLTFEHLGNIVEC